VARQFTKSSGMYLESEGGMTAISAWPVSFVIWYYPDDISSNQNIFRVYENGTAANALTFQLRSSGVLRANLMVSGASTVNDQTSSRHTAGSWACYGARFTSSEVEVYMNGSGTGSATSHSASADTWDSVVIGATESGATEADGRLARACVWSVELSDTDFSSLADGCDPRLIKPESLHFWWEGHEVSGNGLDWKGGVVLTDNNSVGDADHPPNLSMSYSRQFVSSPEIWAIYQSSSISKLIELTAGDTLAVFGKHRSGSSANFLADGSRITITGPLGG